MDTVNIEFYKSLRVECASFHDKIQLVWAQKLTLIGGIIAFLIANPLFKLLPDANDLQFIGILVLPIIAVILDMKVVEYSLHLRTISAYIARNFRAHRLPASWEEQLWGQGESPERLLTLARTLLTIAAVAIPTLILMAIACFFWSRRAPWYWPAMAGSVAFILYGLAVITATIAVLKPPKA